MLDKIFSIKNTTVGNRKYKVITIFGLKIKFHIHNAHKIFKKVQKNYSKVLINLKKNALKRKIRVVFIVSENSKWGYQSLYELFEKSEKFEPIILISLLTSVHKGLDKTRNNSKENYEFFTSRGMNVEYLYKNEKYINLRKFKPDVVFYEQPWDLPEKYMPQNVSNYALTFLCPYSYAVLDDMYIVYNNKFHKYLYKYLIEHELNLKRYVAFDKDAEKVCYVTGYPKMDVYFDNYQGVSPVWRDPDKIKVIYAPHHSFDKKLNLATFQQNYQYILDLAKSHPETTWIFKPHPRFKFAVMKVGIMSEKEIDEYIDEWAQIGVVYTQGDYMDILRSSDVMITDCASFLAEYLPTKKPLIRLINKDGISLNELGEKVSSEYYKSYNNETLGQIFNEVIINKNDYMKGKRLKLIDEVFDYNTTAAQKIFDYINNLT